MAGWVSVETEITRTTRFASRMAHLTKRALLEIAPAQRWKERRAPRRAHSAVVLAHGVDRWFGDGQPGPRAAGGKADSGDLGEDLTDLLVALGEAAATTTPGSCSWSTRCSSSTRGVRGVDRRDPQDRAAPTADHPGGCGSAAAPRLAGEASRTPSGCSGSRGWDPSTPSPPLRRWSARPGARCRAPPPGGPDGADLHRGLSLLPAGVRSRAMGSRRRTVHRRVEAVEAQAVVEAKLDADFFAPARACE